MISTCHDLQLKSIKKELGMQRDEKDAIITDFQEKIKDLVIPKGLYFVIKVISYYFLSLL